MDIQRMLFEAVQSKSNTDNQLMDLCPIILGLKSRLIGGKTRGLEQENIIRIGKISDLRLVDGGFLQFLATTSERSLYKVPTSPRLPYTEWFNHAKA